VVSEGSVGPPASGSREKIDDLMAVDGSIEAPRRKKRALILRGAVAVILIAVMETFRQTDLRWLAALFGLALLDRFFMSAKWVLLLRGRGIRISQGEAFRIYLASAFVGTFLPTGVGGDIYRVIRTANEKRRMATVTASVVIERALGFLAVVVLAFIGLQILMASGEVDFRKFYYATGGVLLVLAAGFFLSIHSRTVDLITRLLSPLARFKPVRLLLKLHAAYSEFGQQRKILLVFFLLTVGERFVQVLMVYLSARTLGMQTAVVYLVALVPLSDFVSLLPISLGGLGVNEGALMILLSHAGMTHEQSLSVALLLRAVGWINLILYGLVFMSETVRVGRPKSAAAGGAVPVEPKEDRGC
jgi:uncharacterized protein (TIRG00374 family)